MAPSQTPLNTYSCLVRGAHSLFPADFSFISAVVKHCLPIYLDELKEQLSLQPDAMFMALSEYLATTWQTHKTDHSY